MTNNELKEIIKELVPDDTENQDIIVLEGDEYADSAIGLSEDNHIVYDYEKMIESLMQQNNWTDTEAIEWIDYNLLGSLKSMHSQGKEPIILMSRFEDFK